LESLQSILLSTPDTSLVFSGCFLWHGDSLKAYSPLPGSLRAEPARCTKPQGSEPEEIAGLDMALEREGLGDSMRSSLVVGGKGCGFR
jgi:hypothetical protein